MKKALFLVIVLVFASMLVGESITVIGPWSGDEEESFKPVLQAFEEKTGITVNYRINRAEDLANVLPAQFNARSAPGDVIFMWSDFITANPQHAVELSDVVDAGLYEPATLRSVMVGDELYGTAYTAKPKPGFWYRKSFFEEHGLSEPNTWDEFVALLEEITEISGIRRPIASGNGVGWPLSDITEHFLITFGGPELQNDLIEGNITWESHIVRRPMEKLAGLLEAGYFSEPTEWTTILEQWWKGDYALYFMGFWIIGMVDDPDDLGVFTLPGARGVVSSVDYAFIPAYADNVEGAKKFVGFISSVEGQSVQVAQGGHFATVAGVSDDAYPPADREVARSIEGLEPVLDLDDTIGGAWQSAFWDQLKLLWVRPGRLNSVLAELEARMP